MYYGYSHSDGSMYKAIDKIQVIKHMKKKYGVNWTLLKEIPSSRLYDPDGLYQRAANE